MALLQPFRALRPTPASAARVAAVPYDVINAEEARALAAGNPLSFLHVSRAEIDLPPDTDSHSPMVYQSAAANFTRLRAQAPLVQEDEPSLYVYRLRLGSHEQTGVAGCYSLDEYDRNLVKKHERTRPDKENDRTTHLLALGAQTGPVFLTYKASQAVDVVVSRTTVRTPLFDFLASDGVTHTVWPVATEDIAELVNAFAQVPALYIADGHHRAASAARARESATSAGRGHGPWDAFLAVAFPGNQTQVLAYHRVIRDLGTHTPETFMAAIGAHHTVRAGGSVPERPGDVCVYLAGAWYTVTIGPAAVGDSESAQLDVSRLQDAVLGPILGIGDVRTDPRIDFVGGARGTSELERLVDSGKAAVAFSMHAVSVDQLMRISDEGGIMPPKSTWFEPKLRDGLLSHLI